jgi:MFS family permease
MAPQQASPTGLLILLSVVALPTALAGVMLGPLLVALAQEFQTSVAVVGHLGAATAITWGLMAPLAGPVSDIYGRRRLLLMGLLLMAGCTLSAVLACGLPTASKVARRRICMRKAAMAGAVPISRSVGCQAALGETSVMPMPLLGGLPARRIGDLPGNLHDQAGHDGQLRVTQQS